MIRCFLAAAVLMGIASATPLFAEKQVATWTVQTGAGEKYIADINGSILRYNTDNFYQSDIPYFYETVNKKFTGSFFKFADMPTTWVKTFEIIGLSKNYALVKYTDNKDPELVTLTAYAVFMIKSNGTNLVRKNSSGGYYYQISPLSNEYFVGMDSGRLISHQYDDKGNILSIRNYNISFVENSLKRINGSNLKPLNPKISAFYIDEIVDGNITNVEILKY